MSASIRLKRFGTKKRPYYRILVIDSRAPRDGKTIEEVGLYHPIETEEKQISFDADKVRSWVNKGASVSDTVRSILNKKDFHLQANA
jgi:small subunit ribosomal protein S16